MNWLISILGLALAATPFVFGAQTNSSASFVGLALGLIVFVVAAVRALSKSKEAKWEYWVAGVAGLAAVAAAFVARPEPAALWSAVIIGVAIAALSAYQALGRTTRVARPA